ncbi:hypothetical protein ANN_28046 [Periplaneta americana]|uniref:Uncharacterized protein n=1 Tax=Periplaneta americana TaxID=6978 RepID=A0ABQ8RUS8_PERAM|nr:hypothetical protein ANN_28046 [Periplaneta americana]
MDKRKFSGGRRTQTNRRGGATMVQGYITKTTTFPEGYTNDCMGESFQKHTPEQRNPTQTGAHIYRHGTIHCS